MAGLALELSSRLRRGKVQLQSRHNWGGALANLVDVTASQAKKYINRASSSPLHQMFTIFFPFSFSCCGLIFKCREICFTFKGENGI